MDRSSWATSNLVWGLSVFFFSFPFESCVGLMDGFSRILRSLGMRQWNLSNNAPFRVSVLLPLSPAPFWQDLCSSRHPSFPVPHTPPQTQSGLSCCLLSAMLSAFNISSLQPIHCVNYSPHTSSIPVPRGLEESGGVKQCFTRRSPVDRCGINA